MMKSAKTPKKTPVFLFTRLGLVFSVLLILLFPCRTFAGGPREEAVLRAFQKKMNGLRDWAADFRQKAYLAVVDQYESSSGRVRIKKPGKIFWEYLEPDREVLSSDGKKLYFYSEEDRQVIVRDLDAKASAGANLLFLAGDGKLGDLFTLRLVGGDTRDPVRIKMIPKTAQANLVYLILTLRGTSLGLLSLQSFDAVGNNTLVEFFHVRENPRLPEKIFYFRVPEGTEVIQP